MEGGGVRKNEKGEWESESERGERKNTFYENVWKKFSISGELFRANTKFSFWRVRGGRLGNRDIPAPNQLDTINYVKAD